MTESCDICTRVEKASSKLLPCRFGCDVQMTEFVDESCQHMNDAFHICMSHRAYCRFACDVRMTEFVDESCQHTKYACHICMSHRAYCRFGCDVHMTEFVDESYRIWMSRSPI